MKIQNHFIKNQNIKVKLKALNNFKNTVILRPSVVCGTEDNFTNLFSKLSILPVIPVVGINYKFQPILVDDVADAIVQAIEQKIMKEKFMKSVDQK